MSAEQQKQRQRLERRLHRAQMRLRRWAIRWEEQSTVAPVDVRDSAFARIDSNLFRAARNYAKIYAEFDGDRR
jgi:hypothetical protein